MKAEFLAKELHGTGTRKYVIDHQTTATRTEMHWHNCIEIVYVEKGNVQVFFDNKPIILCAGDMIFIPPERVHCMYCGNDTHKTVIGLTKSLICDENIDEESLLMPFETEIINLHCLFHDQGELKEIFKVLNSADNSHYGSLIIQSEILKLYANIYKEWIKRGLSFIEPVKDKYISDIIKVLKSDCCNPPTASKMADTLHISYSHMHKIISSKLGTNYVSLLNSIRIENAKKLLLTTERSITDIGFDCGFTDNSYFIKMFRKSTGLTPKKYRMTGTIL